MTGIHFTQLTPPYSELQTLKENKYKKVCLNRDATGNLFISKHYRGHKLVHSLANSKYAFDTLKYFYDKFNDVAKIPAPFGHDQDSSTIYLEYLESLPNARVLTNKNIGLATAFFNRCYELKELGSFRSITQSIACDDAIRRWISQGKPMSLGLKGDLWANLCEQDSKLIFADIDSAAVEPFGFSELIMRAEISVSFNTKTLTLKSRAAQPPICFNHLDKCEARNAIRLAFRLIERRMSHLPSTIRKLKLELASRCMNIMHDSYYE